MQVIICTASVCVGCQWNRRPVSNWLSELCRKF